VIPFRNIILSIYGAARYLFFSILLLALLPLAASAVLPPRFGGTLRAGIPDRPADFDPSEATQDYEFMIASCIFETLLEPGPGDSVVPVLLDQMPAMSDDGLTYYFKLKENVKFHDATFLDSADVLHTFKKLIKNRHSPYHWILRDVAGAEQFRTGRDRTIEGFRITGPLRFEITLSKKNDDFLKYLTFPAASIIPTADRDFEPPVGTGPFIFYEKLPRGDVVLTAHKNYRRGRPYLNSIEFRVIRDERERFVAFEAGDLDVVDVPLSGLSEEEESAFPEAVTSVMKRLFFLDLHPGYLPLRSFKLRAAVSSVIDRDAIVRGILNGHGTSEPGPSLNPDPAILREPAAASPPLPLWYTENEPELERAAERIGYDLAGFDIKTEAVSRSRRGLVQFSDGEPPALVLRSLPILFSVEETIDTPLFDAEFQTAVSAAAVRLGLIEELKDERDPRESGLVIKLFSRRASYLHQESIHGLVPGYFGQPAFGDAWIRAEKSDIESLDN